MLGLITWYQRESACETWDVFAVQQHLTSCALMHASFCTGQCPLSKTCPRLGGKSPCVLFLWASLLSFNVKFLQTMHLWCSLPLPTPPPTSFSMTSFLLGPGHFTFCPLFPRFWAVLCVAPEELTPVQSSPSLQTLLALSLGAPATGVLTVVLPLWPLWFSHLFFLFSQFGHPLYAQVWAPLENNNICFTGQM